MTINAYGMDRWIELKLPDGWIMVEKFYGNTRMYEINLGLKRNIFKIESEVNDDYIECMCGPYDSSTDMKFNGYEAKYTPMENEKLFGGTIKIKGNKKSLSIHYASEDKVEYESILKTLNSLVIK